MIETAEVNVYYKRQIVFTNRHFTINYYDKTIWNIEVIILKTYHYSLDIPNNKLKL